MNKKLFPQISKKIFLHEKGIQNIQLMHPMREWMVGLGVGVFILLLSAAWSTHTYLSHQKSGSVETTASEVVVYRDAQVAAALAEFEERKELLEALTAAKQTNLTLVETTEVVEINQEAALPAEAVASSSPAVHVPAPEQEVQESVVEESDTEVLVGDSVATSTLQSQ